MHNTLKLIYGIYLGLTAVVCFCLIVPLLPVVRNVKILSVLTGSMEPVFHAGGVVIVAPAAKYEIGDVITFGQLSRFKIPTTHRIYAVESIDGQSVYTTKGDANKKPDGRKILLSDIDGKVLVTMPYLGYGLNFFLRPMVFGLVIIIPAIVVVFVESRKIYREVAVNKRETENV